jgi:N-acetylmuramoyl-L-alanine amidase
MFPIEKMLIKYNISPRNGAKIEYVVIHNTSNPGGTAINHYNYFNGGNRNSSADYFVDDKRIIQLVDDSNYSWAVGDGKNRNGINNKNSVSIEICEVANYNEAVNQSVELAKYLLKKYNLGIDRLKRHYDASYKNCPNRMNNNGDWSAWNDFKNRVAGANVSSPSPSANVNSDNGNLRRGSNGSGVSDLQNKLNKFGYGLGVDGDFGPATENAVKDFQSKNGLDSDGVVGPMTRSKLDEVINRNSQPATTPAPQSQYQPSGRTLRRGDKGDDVKDLQNRLNSLGFDCGAADGDFGNNTHNAVVRFQQAKGLDADGIVGNMTKSKLQEGA